MRHAVSTLIVVQNDLQLQIVSRVNCSRKNVDCARFQREMSVSGSQYENGMKALSEMDRTQQVEAITSYNSMKSDLMDYLKTFAEEGKVLFEK